MYNFSSSRKLVKKGFSFGKLKNSRFLLSILALLKSVFFTEYIRHLLTRLRVRIAS